MRPLDFKYSDYSVTSSSSHSSSQNNPDSIPQQQDPYTKLQGNLAAALSSTGETLNELALTRIFNDLPILGPNQQQIEDHFFKVCFYNSDLDAFLEWVRHLLVLHFQAFFGDNAPSPTTLSPWIREQLKPFGYDSIQDENQKIKIVYSMMSSYAQLLMENFVDYPTQELNPEARKRMMFFYQPACSYLCGTTKNLAYNAAQKITDDRGKTNIALALQSFFKWYQASFPGMREKWKEIERFVAAEDEQLHMMDAPEIEDDNPRFIISVIQHEIIRLSNEKQFDKASAITEALRKVLNEFSNKQQGGSHLYSRDILLRMLPILKEQDSQAYCNVRDFAFNELLKIGRETYLRVAQPTSTMLMLDKRRNSNRATLQQQDAQLALHQWTPSQKVILESRIASLFDKNVSANPDESDISALSESVVTRLSMDENHNVSRIFSNVWLPPSPVYADEKSTDVFSVHATHDDIDRPPVGTSDDAWLFEAHFNLSNEADSNQWFLSYWHSRVSFFFAEVDRVTEWSSKDGLSSFPEWIRELLPDNFKNITDIAEKQGILSTIFRAYVAGLTEQLTGLLEEERDEAFRSQLLRLHQYISDLFKREPTESVDDWMRRALSCENIIEESPLNASSANFSRINTDPLPTSPKCIISVIKDEIARWRKKASEIRENITKLKSDLVSPDLLKLLPQQKSKYMAQAEVELEAAKKEQPIILRKTKEIEAALKTAMRKHFKISQFGLLYSREILREVLPVLRSVSPHDSYVRVLGFAVDSPLTILSSRAQICIATPANEIPDNTSSITHVTTPWIKSRLEQQDTLLSEHIEAYPQNKTLYATLTQLQETNNTHLEECTKGMSGVKDYQDYCKQRFWWRHKSVKTALQLKELYKTALDVNTTEADKKTAIYLSRQLQEELRKNDSGFTTFLRLLGFDVGSKLYRLLRDTASAFPVTNEIKTLTAQMYQSAVYQAYENKYAKTLPFQPEESLLVTEPVQVIAKSGPVFFARPRTPDNDQFVFTQPDNRHTATPTAIPFVSDGQPISPAPTQIRDNANSSYDSSSTLVN